MDCSSACPEACESPIGKVSVKAHRRVLEVHQLKYWGFFSDVLRDKPAAFFYGAKDTAITTEEAAALSTAPQEEGGRPSFRVLTEKSLHAIWEAARISRGIS